MSKSPSNHKPSTAKLWVIIPAAGIGTRFGSAQPKQYAPLRGSTVLGHSLRSVSGHPLIAGVLVVLAPNDPYWPKFTLNLPVPVQCVEGGAERYLSVFNGLKALTNQAEDNDWILVHDAARPCLRKQDLHRLIDSLYKQPVGGILAAPVRDTMKRAGKNQEIQQTVNRENLWHALTPQMFRYRLLYDCLQRSLEENVHVTDEAAALELYGYRPALVTGAADNIKITNAEDLLLAEFFLSQQEE